MGEGRGATPQVARCALGSVSVAATDTEVINELVRLMTGQSDVRSLTKDERYALAAALIPGTAREMLYRTLASLNDDGDTFAQIADRLSVHEATAARWAKPPAEDRRRRRAEGEQQP